MLVICDNSEVIKTCSALKHDKVRLAKYLSAWLQDTVGMTAEINPNHNVEAVSKLDHPSTFKFSDLQSGDTEKDVSQCQKSFQMHKCSQYCMRKKHAPKDHAGSGEDTRRICRCGAGMEENFGKCDTPGFVVKDQPAIVKDPRGFERIDLKRNDKFVVQASTFLCQGWRGNCDMQYLLYLSDSADVDASEICRVTNYIVSYACKGNETEVDEKNSLRALINSAQTEYGDARDVKKVARRVLNECSKARVISKQEATCQLAGLNLYTCSEKVQIESLSGELRLGTEHEARSSLLVRYAHRRPELKCMNLYDFFDYTHNKPENLKKKTGW